jgi:hypothetical protein
MYSAQEELPLTCCSLRPKGASGASSLFSMLTMVPMKASNAFTSAALEDCAAQQRACVSKPRVSHEKANVQHEQLQEQRQAGTGDARAHLAIDSLAGGQDGQGRNETHLAGGF